MTVGITIYPDGLSQLPPMSRDDEIVAMYLESSGYGNWENVSRITSATTLRLRIGDGAATMDDFQQSDLDAVSSSLIDNINGLVASPFGWHTLDETELTAFE